MEKGEVMTRKDSEKDAERPHYYSQFWLDIAAGRRVIGGPKPEEAEASEPEAPEPVLIRKAGRGTSNASDTYKAAVPAVELVATEAENEPEEDTIDETELPNIVVEEDTEYTDEAESEAAEEDFSEDEDEFFDEEEEDEEDEDSDWNPRGRKKAKPVRPVKPVNKPKRVPRRGF